MEIFNRETQLMPDDSREKTGFRKGNIMEIKTIAVAFRSLQASLPAGIALPAVTVLVMMHRRK